MPLDLTTMSKLILNIGLAPSTNTSRKEAITRAEVLAALRGAGFFVSSYAEALSTTKQTAVITVDAKDVHAFRLVGALFNVSQALAQDCIAVCNPATNYGELIGPDAAARGAFNPAYFIHAWEVDAILQAA